MPINYEEGDKEFSPKVCNQIHKRVEEKINRIECDISRLRDNELPNLERRVLEKLHEYELRMMENVQHADTIAYNTINNISDSIKEGITSATNGVNTLRKELEHTQDDLEEKVKKINERIPQSHREEHDILKTFRNKVYWTMAGIIGVVVFLLPYIFDFIKKVSEHLLTSQQIQ